MRFRNKEVNRGGILIVVVVMCGIVGATLVAYLGMVQSQERFVHRSAVWNNCIVLCESGVEEALSHLNHRDTTSNFAINGWSYSSSAFRKPRYLSGGKCEMTISTNYPPIITVSAKLPAPMNHGEVTRTVRVGTKVSRVFPYAILSKSRVTLGGSGRVDSFNSTNILESLNGRYSAALATDRATIASLTRNATDFSVGNVDIFGYVATGPGAAVSVGPNGVVGDKLFALNPLNSGKIQAGHSRNDFNVYIPDAALPPNFSPLPIPLSPGSVGGTNYTYVAGNGDFSVAGNLTMGNGEVLLVTGRARILVRGNVNLTGDAGIILTTNATVEWYQAGSTVNMGGRGVVNSRGFAKDFQLIGLSTCNSISYAGSFQFTGTVYAPSSTVILTGSADAYGALIGNSIELSGGMGLHYDESLNSPQKARFIASSWQEIKL
jgi:hypothetical protein